MMLFCASCLFFCLFVCLLFVSLFVCLFVCLFACLFVCCLFVVCSCLLFVCLTTLTIMQPPVLPHPCPHLHFASNLGDAMKLFCSAGTSAEYFCYSHYGYHSYCCFRHSSYFFLLLLSFVDDVVDVGGGVDGWLLWLWL